MTTIRLFGENIEVKEKSIKLFGKIIIVSTLQEEPKEAALLLQQEEPQQVAPLILQEEQEALIKRDLPPPNMREAILLTGGSGLVYIGRKKVEDSDVNKNLSRFFIPAGTYDKKILKYLSSREIEKLEDKNNYKGLQVRVMDPQGNFHDMNFTRWKSLSRHVFNKGWNKFVLANKLQKGDIVDLWPFRIGSQLCFAINIIRA